MYIPKNGGGRFPKIEATFFGGPHDKDYKILESILILVFPYFGKLTNKLVPRSSPLPQTVKA